MVRIGYFHCCGPGSIPGWELRFHNTYLAWQTIRGILSFSLMSPGLQLNKTRMLIDMWTDVFAVKPEEQGK